MHSAFAQGVEQAASPAQGDPYFRMMMPLIIIFAVFYFIVIRPQSQNQKKAELERKNMLGNLGKNDEVITASGIHGTVMNVKDTTVILKIDDNVKIEIQKEAVATVKKKRE